jgi:hypothetical protein
MIDDPSVKYFAPQILKYPEIPKGRMAYAKLAILKDADPIQQIRS